MTRHKNRGLHLKGPYKVKKIMRHYWKEERVEIRIPYYHVSPDHRVLKHFVYSYLPPAKPENPVLPEKSFSPD